MNALAPNPTIPADDAIVRLAGNIILTIIAEPPYLGNIHHIKGGAIHIHLSTSCFAELNALHILVLHKAINMDVATKKADLCSSLDFLPRKNAISLVKPSITMPQPAKFLM